MTDVITNGVDSSVSNDDTNFTPFTPAVPMTDSRSHADYLVLAWVLLLYRNSAESAFTSGLHSTVDGTPSRTPTTSGFVAQFVASRTTLVSDVLDRIREQTIQPPSTAAWDGESMFFSNAGSLAEQDPNVRSRSPKKNPPQSK